MKKIALVTHEFGLFKNAGGIASYLYSFSKIILDNFPNIEVYVLTCLFHEQCDLVCNERFHIRKLKSMQLSSLGCEIRDCLIGIKPDYVEVTDYHGLALESLVYKFLIGKQLRDTVFLVYTHTATREIYQWGNCGKIRDASPELRGVFKREWAQMVIADAVISPSKFLQEYTYNNYFINKPIHIPLALSFNFKDKCELYTEMEKVYDVETLKNRFVISYISRFESRKNQKAIVSIMLKFIKEVCSNVLLILAGNTMLDPNNGKNLMLSVYEAIPREYRRNFMFYEYASDEEKKKIFSISDLTIMTSKFENFPVIMLEAVCNGIPIMVSETNGASDYMGKYKNEMTFDPQNCSSLYSKIIQFYMYTKELRLRIAEEQARSLKELCRIENTVIKKFNLFENTVDYRKDAKEDCDIIIVDKRSKDTIRVSEDSCVIFTSGKWKNNKSGFILLIKRIANNPGKFVVSFAPDFLHTDLEEVVGEGFPVLFTHVRKQTQPADRIFDELVREYKDLFLCIPIDMEGVN